MNIRQGSIRTPRALAAAFVCVVVALLAVLPTSASADLADEIVTAIQDAVQGMIGTEFGVDYVTFDLWGVELKATVLGFAFCAPSDPWADPVATPVPPNNVYGCENVSTVGTDVNVGQTSADVTIGISNIFLDLETERDEALFCLPWGDTVPLTSVVTEDGYMLGHAIIGATLLLTRVGGCVRASLAPGSVDFILTPDVVESQDNCIDSNMNSAVLPVLYPLVQDHLDAVFEVALMALMDQISDMICQATPTVPSTWGAMKGLYGSTP
jgi:hypothetical protein